MKHIDIIANKFCSRDDTRPQLMKLHGEGDLVITTNAHVLLKAPAGYFAETYEPVEGFPSWQRVIPEHDSTVIIGELPIAELDRCERLLPKEPVYAECEQCEGTGAYCCKCCGSDCDCKECKGDGTTDTILYREVNSFDHAIEIEGAIFNPNFLFLILELAQFLAKPINVVRMSETSACIFYVDEIMILVMPILKALMDEQNTEIKNIVPIKIVKAK